MDSDENSCSRQENAFVTAVKVRCLREFHVIEPASAAADSTRPALTFVGTESQKKTARKAVGLWQTAAVVHKSSEQEEALERMLNGLDSALAVVLLTGGGKTLLFTAPACLDDPGMTIFVVP